MLELLLPRWCSYRPFYHPRGEAKVAEGLGVLSHAGFDRTPKHSAAMIDRDAPCHVI